MKWTFFGIALGLGLAGCASPTQVPEPKPAAPQMKEPEERVDLNGLSRSLGMNRELENLGYAEKSFNTCRAGFGYSPSHNCRQRHLVVVNFRLQCRDSEGTVTMVTNEELMPVTSGQVRWNLGSYQGMTATDGEGYGQVLMVAPESSRQQRLRLTVADDFLIMTASQVKRIIVPKPWCGR